MSQQYTQLVVDIEKNALWQRVLLQLPAQTPTSTTKRRARRTAEETRQRSANVIQRFFRLVCAKRVMRAHLRERSCVIIQSLFRGAKVRSETRSVVEERRRVMVLQQYSRHHHLALDKLPATHRLHIAARRIQLLCRRRMAAEKVQEAIKNKAVKCIQRAYHTHKFRAHVHDTQHRLQRQRERVDAATKIQALYRGFACRKSLNNDWEGLRQRSEVSFSTKHRNRRASKRRSEVDAMRTYISDSQRRAEELEVLEMVLSTPDPNREIVAASTKSAFESRIRVKNPRPKQLPPIMNVRAGGSQSAGMPFEPMAQVLHPGMQTVLMTEGQPATVPISTLGDIRREAAAVAKRKIMKKAQVRQPWEVADDDASEL